MNNEIIELKTHNSDWAYAFEQQAARLKAVLGDYIEAAHHVGSTAIPTIKAKPIIDIAIESTVFPPDKYIVDTLAELAYVEHGQAGVAGRYWFSKGSPRVFNLHWCPINGMVVQLQVQFRDKLRADKHLAAKYEAIKISTSAGKHIDSADYAEAKRDFIQMVLSH